MTEEIYKESMHYLVSTTASPAISGGSRLGKLTVEKSGEGVEQEIITTRCSKQ
jgi:hypothetical protein